MELTKAFICTMIFIHRVVAFASPSHERDDITASSTNERITLRAGPTSQRNNILERLKSYQYQPASLIEEKSARLTRQVLGTKHLATYFGEITIDGQTFNVLFDTGSCEFWVPSSECQTPVCLAHRRYNVSALQRDQIMDAPPLNVEYISGHVRGRFILSTVTVGDVSVERQPVGLGSNIDIELLNEVVWDGILGLAYPNPGQKDTPFFDMVMNQGRLTSRNLANQFGYFIDDSGNGAITLGGADCTLFGQGVGACVEKYSFVPVVDPSYWTIRLVDVRVQLASGQMLESLCPSHDCRAIVDSGTYMTYAPSTVHSIFPSTQLILQSCRDIEQLPTFYFDVFAGDGKPKVTLSLTPRDYILEYIVAGREDCVAGIAADNNDDPKQLWTLGQTFLRVYSPLFDRRGYVGFAKVPRPSFLQPIVQIGVPMLVEQRSQARFKKSHHQK